MLIFAICCYIWWTSVHFAKNCTIYLSTAYILNFFTLLRVSTYYLLSSNCGWVFTISMVNEKGGIHVGYPQTWEFNYMCPVYCSKRSLRISLRGILFSITCQYLQVRLMVGRIFTVLVLQIFLPSFILTPIDCVGFSLWYRSLHSSQPWSHCLNTAFHLSSPSSPFPITLLKFEDPAHHDLFI